MQQECSSTLITFCPSHSAGGKSEIISILLQKATKVFRFYLIFFSSLENYRIFITMLTESSQKLSKVAE